MPADYVRAAMGIEESHKELESKRQAASWSAPRMIGFLVVIAATYSLAARRTSDVLPLQTPPFLPCGWTATRRLLSPPLGCADQVNRSACVRSFVAAPDRLYIHACHWAGGDGDGEAPPRCVALQRQRLLCSFQQSRAARGRGRGNRSQGGGRLRGHPSAAQHHGHSGGHPSAAQHHGHSGGGGGVGRLTPGVCRDMLAAGPGSRFYGMWGRRAWCARQEGGEACWGGGARAEQWFASVEAGAACERDWGVPPAAPAVLGFSDTTLKYCNAQLGEGWVARGEHRERCRRANVSILRIGGWTMCKNLEWLMCALRGRLAPAAVPARLRGQLVVSLPLSRLDTRRLQSGSFSVPHTGNERKVCTNRDQLFNLSRSVGDPFSFRCEYDRAGYARLREMLQR